MEKNIVIRPESLRFAHEFSDEIRRGKYKKDHLPNQGVPMNEEYAKERLKVFNGILDADILGVQA